MTMMIATTRAFLVVVNNTHHHDGACVIKRGGEVCVFCCCFVCSVLWEKNKQVKSVISKFFKVPTFFTKGRTFFFESFLEKKTLLRGIKHTHRERERVKT